MLAVLGIFAAVGLLVKALISLAVFVFWVWMLIHAVTNKRLGDGEKIAWVLVIIFVPCLGALIYFFVGKPKGGP
jgi:uncharacterized membrane protein YhaH (DUF805 family)